MGWFLQSFPWGRNCSWSQKHNPKQNSYTTLSLALETHRLTQELHPAKDGMVERETFQWTPYKTTVQMQCWHCSKLKRNWVLFWSYYCKMIHLQHHSCVDTGCAKGKVTGGLASPVVRPHLPHLQHEWDQASHYKGSSGTSRPALSPPLWLKGHLHAGTRLPQGELATSLRTRDELGTSDPAPLLTASPRKHKSVPKETEGTQDQNACCMVIMVKMVSCTKRNSLNAMRQMQAQQVQMELQKSSGPKTNLFPGLNYWGHVQHILFL